MKTMTEIITNSIFYLTGLLLLYTWILFPGLMLLAWHRICRRIAPIDHKQTRDNIHVCILIAAWNEEAVIADRIKNLTMLDDPSDRISVWIGTDGCTDHTANVARQTARKFPNLEMHIEEYEANRGKASVIVDLTKQAMAHSKAKETILVFTDANTYFARDAICQLLPHFNEPQTGGVCGQLQFTRKRDQPEHAYWSFENKLKQIESWYDSCLGANGAIYAVRPTCFWNELPPQTIIDDFMIGMKVREAGMRMKYEPRAIAYEELPDTEHEWNRRVRIGAGDYQAMLWCRACLHPRYGIFALFFWSHKIFRWFTPHAVLLVTTSAIMSLILTRNHAAIRIIPPFTVVLCTLIIALLTCFHTNLEKCLNDKGAQWISRLHHFVTMQAALFVGFMRFCKGDLHGYWKRTPRIPQTNENHDHTQENKM